MSPIRSEAKGVPNLLTAPKIVAIEEGQGEEELYQDYPQGFYDDGAYVAIPLASSIHNPNQHTKVGNNDNEDIDPQEAYHTLLLTRFRHLRSLLHSSLPSTHPHPSIPSNLTTPTTIKKWRTTFLYTSPTPNLLATLPQDSIIQGISALEKYLGFQMLARGEYVGAWAWGLLARCREVGMMGSEEVGIVRDLGKKAGGLVRRMEAGLGGMGGEDKGKYEGPGEEGDYGEGEDGREEGEGEEEGEEEAAEEDVEEDDPSAAKGIDTSMAEEITSDTEAGNANPSQPNPAAVEEEDRSQNTTPTETQHHPPDPNTAIAEAKSRLITTLHHSSPSSASSPVSSTPPALLQASTTATILNQPTTSPPPNESLIPTHNPTPHSKQSPAPVAAPSKPPITKSPTREKPEAIPLATRISATLDAIVTIVGEDYRQRDLLAGRGVWG